MKKNVMREVTIYICDVCGEECGLPYRGRDDKGYGDCCDTKMRKAERYLIAVNTIRDLHGLPQIELTFDELAETSKMWVGTGYDIKRATKSS